MRAAILLALLPCTASAGVTVLSFEEVEGAPFWDKSAVPAGAFVGSRYQASGVRIDSLAGSAAVVNGGLGHAPDGTNMLAPTNASGQVDWSSYLVFRFFLPGTSEAGQVSMFSLRQDLWAGSVPVRLTAYDALDNVLLDETFADTGQVMTLASAGISRVLVHGRDLIGGSGGIGLDVLTFDTPTAVPEPSALVALALGLLGGLRVRRRDTQQGESQSG